VTLIAAYRPFGVPTLIGDFLITVKGGGLEWAGKKIQILTDNCAVGWTGRMLMAKEALESVKSELNGPRTTWRDLSRALGRLRGAASPLDLALIGWIIDEDPKCFRWNAHTPADLSVGPVQVAGSGTEVALRTLVSRNYRGSAFKNDSDYMQRAIHSALNSATWLYLDEFFGQINRRQGFGLCYEAVYFNGTCFRSIDDVAFLGMDVQWDGISRTYRSFLYRHWCKYASFGDGALIRTIDNQKGRMELHTVLPLVPEPAADAVQEFVAGDYRSDYYCVFMRLQAVGENRTFNASITLRDSPRPAASLYARQRDGRFSLEIPPETIGALYSRMTQEVERLDKCHSPFGWGAAETTQSITSTGMMFQFGVEQDDKTVVVGLIPEGDWDKDFRSLPFSMMLRSDGMLLVYEDGLAVGPAPRPYSAAQVFGISVERLAEGDTVCYYQAGQRIYRSRNLPGLPLRGCAALFEDGASVTGATFVVVR
jgi:hypothetical protein